MIDIKDLLKFAVIAILSLYVGFCVQATTLQSDFQICLEHTNYDIEHCIAFLKELKETNK